jgi:hypothetical protein
MNPIQNKGELRQSKYRLLHGNRSEQHDTQLET